MRCEKHVLTWGEQEQTWHCDRCGGEFLSAHVVEDLLQTAAEKVDMAASVAAAMMWDFHERAVERYGKDSPQEQALRPGHDAPEDDDPREVCEAEGHLYKNGTCDRCGASVFLGEN